MILDGFNEKSVVDAVKHGATMISLVPAMLKRLLAYDKENVISRLRVALLGGASIPQKLVTDAISKGVNVVRLMV